MLTENERDILLGQIAPRRTATDAGRALVDRHQARRARVGNVNRKILGDVSATLNTELEHQEGRSLIGLGETLLDAARAQHSSDSAHAGIALNGTKKEWRWTLTGNADLDRDVTRTDRDDAGFPRDRARETSTSGDSRRPPTANCSSFRPAMRAPRWRSAGARPSRQRPHRGGVDSGQFTRTNDRQAAMNLDLPVSRRKRDFSALGNLTLNGNAEVDQLSDFGTLTNFGAGANWSPVDGSTSLPADSG